MVYIWNFNAVSQINARHEFLTRFIGTQVREDISYNEANSLNLWVTLTTCLCCLLEIGLYSAYNKWVRTISEYHKNIILCRCIRGSSLYEVALLKPKKQRI